MKKVYLLVYFIMIATVSMAQNVKPIKFSELEQRYKLANDTTYVVNFWATWCAPCVKELPNFSQLQKEFKTDKLKVLLVSMDFRSKLETVVIPFVKKKGIDLETVLLDEKDTGTIINKVNEKWSGSIPGTLVINQSKGVNNFYEQEFNYEELKNLYLTIKNNNKL